VSLLRLINKCCRGWWRDVMMMLPRSILIHWRHFVRIGRGRSNDDWNVQWWKLPLRIVWCWRIQRLLKVREWWGRLALLMRLEIVNCTIKVRRNRAWRWRLVEPGVWSLRRTLNLMVGKFKLLLGLGGKAVFHANQALDRRQSALASHIHCWWWRWVPRRLSVDRRTVGACC